MKKMTLFLLFLFIISAPLKGNTVSDILLYKGILLMEQNDPLAINLFIEAHNIDMNNPEPLYYMGLYYLRAGSIDDAITYFNKTAEFNDKRFVNVYYDLGRLYLWKGEYKKARKNFYKYLKVFRNDPFGKFYYSIAALFTGGDKKILKFFNSSATLLPELRDVANYYIAFSYLYWQDRDNALEWLKNTVLSTDNREMKRLANRYIYFLKQDQSFYKRYGLYLESFSGYDSNPEGDYNEKGSSFSNLDFQGFYLTAPGKSIQFGIKESFNSKFYFNADLRAPMEYMSRTSLDLFLPFEHSRLGVEGTVLIDRFSPNDNYTLSYDGESKYLFTLFGDFSGTLLNTFRFGSTFYLDNKGELVDGGKGIELFIRDFYIFDAGKSSFVSSFKYVNQFAGYFSKFGPQLDFYLDKHLFWKMSGKFFVTGSVFNYNEYIQNRTVNSLLYEGSIYVSWVKYFLTGITIGRERNIDRQQSYTRNWMGIWLKGQF